MTAMVEAGGQAIRADVDTAVLQTHRFLWVLTESVSG